MSNILEQYFFRVKSNLEHPLTSKSAKGLYKELKEKSWDSAMAHGLPTPIEAFFIEIPNFWAWADNLGRQFGQIRFGAFVVFSADFWYCESLVHVFH